MSARPSPYNNPCFAEEGGALEDFARNNSIAPTHVQPGENGTLPAMDRGGYGIQSMVWGGPMQTGQSPTPPGHGAAQMTEDLPPAARWDSCVANQTDGFRDRLNALEVRDEIKRRQEEDLKRKPSRRIKATLMAMVKRKNNADFGHGRVEVVGWEGMEL